jgi:3-polyprenyl-4-hydroxybenzoate decarboxylase
MLYNDLREWIQKVDEFGELKVLEGCDWKYEMGAVTEVYARNPPYSAILFDKIKDIRPAIACWSACIISRSNANA